MSETPEGDKLDGVITAMVIMATVMGAIIAWRAAVTANNAGGADLAGIRSLTWAESSRAVHTVDAFDDYRLFLNYKNNDQVGDLIEEKSGESESEDEQVGLDRDLEEAREIAQLNVSWLDETKSSRYLTRDGTFAIKRQLAEKWSEAGREHDLNPEPRFQDADRLRDKKESQVKAAILLSFALFFLTLCRLFKGGGRVVFLGVGVVLFLSGTVWALLLEQVA